MKAGDKCPSCKQGLLEANAKGLDCSADCGFDMEIAAVVEANHRAEVEAGEYTWKPRAFKIPGFDTPEEGEEFLRGLILARQNNNSDYFPMLIDAVNATLEPWRKHKLLSDLAKRGS